MTTLASQITSLAIVYSIVYSDADQRKHQSSASLAFVWGIHRDRYDINHDNTEKTTAMFYKEATNNQLPDVIVVVINQRGCGLPEPYITTCLESSYTL